MRPSCQQRARPCRMRASHGFPCGKASERMLSDRAWPWGWPVWRSWSALVRRWPALPSKPARQGRRPASARTRASARTSPARRPCMGTPATPQGAVRPAHGPASDARRASQRIFRQSSGNLPAIFWRIFRQSFKQSFRRGCERGGPSRNLPSLCAPRGHPASGTLRTAQLPQPAGLPSAGMGRREGYAWLCRLPAAVSVDASHPMALCSTGASPGCRHPAGCGGLFSRAGPQAPWQFRIP